MNIAKAGQASSGGDAPAATTPTRPPKRTATINTGGWWLTGLYSNDKVVNRRAIPMPSRDVDMGLSEIIVGHTFSPDAVLAWVCVGELP